MRKKHLFKLKVRDSTAEVGFPSIGRKWLNSSYTSVSSVHIDILLKPGPEQSYLHFKLFEDSLKLQQRETNIPVKCFSLSKLLFSPVFMFKEQTWSLLVQDGKYFNAQIKSSEASRAEKAEICKWSTKYTTAKKPHCVPLKAKVKLLLQWSLQQEIKSSISHSNSFINYGIVTVLRSTVIQMLFLLARN